MNAATPAERHVLLVDDDAVLLSFLTRLFRQTGFRVSEARDGRAMRKVLAEDPPDLVILDINLPDESGLVLAREVRTTTRAGIIMLTARQEDVSRMVALEMGADNYLTKPFREQELMVLVRNLMRRVPAQASNDDPADASYSFAEWRFFPHRQLLTAGDTQVALTRAEAMMLGAFIAEEGNVLTREQLLDAIHGRATGSGDRTIDVIILRLRRKLNDDPRAPRFIVTAPGVGYYFGARVARD
jgi:two-component system torCAD operon response regulator TorR